MRVWDANHKQMRRVLLSSFCGGYTKKFAELVVAAYEEELSNEVFAADFATTRKEMDQYETLPTVMASRR